MPYASQAAIEARYPGWLTLAAAKTAAGALDTVAIGLACAAADDPIHQTLHTLGWTVPVAAPVPAWIVNLAVDLAAYLATTTALASEDALKDRRKRYEDALKTLDDIATGKVLPPPVAGSTPGSGVFFSSQPRQFGRGVL